MQPINYKPILIPKIPPLPVSKAGIQPKIPVAAPILVGKQIQTIPGLPVPKPIAKLSTLTEAPNFGPVPVTQVTQVVPMIPGLPTQAAAQPLVTKGSQTCYLNGPSNFPFLPDARKVASLKDSIKYSPGAAHKNNYQNTLDALYLQNFTCDALNENYVKDLQSNLYQLNLDKINRQLDRFEYPGLRKNLACMFSAIAKDQGPNPNLARIQYLFRDLTLLGDASIQGYALRANLSPDPNPGKPIAIIKTAKPGTIDFVAHEALVGLRMANVLRWDYDIPNFMSVYTYINCSSTVLEQQFTPNDKHVASWCSSEGKNGYMIAELINDSVSLKQYINQLDLRTYITIFLQLVNALNVASFLFNFTHYDLHYENVLIQYYGQPVNVPYYRVENGKLVIKGYISTQYVPVIIDYGYSYVEIPIPTSTIPKVTVSDNSHSSENYLGKYTTGFQGHAQDNIFADRSYPVSDIYKLLTFSATAVTIIKNNQFLFGYGTGQQSQIFDFLAKCTQFFKDVNGRPENLRELIRISEKNKTNFPIALYQASPETSLESFWVYLQTLIKLEDYIQIKPYPSRGLAMDSCEFYREFLEAVPIRSVFEYCDTVKSLRADPELTDDVKTQKIVSINQQTDLLKLQQTEWPNYRKFLQEAKLLSRKYNLSMYRGRTVLSDLDLKTLNSILQQILRVNEIRIDVNNWLSALKCAWALKGGNLTDREILGLRDDLLQLQEYINENKNIIRVLADKDKVKLGSETESVTWRRTLNNTLAAL